MKKQKNILIAFILNALFSVFEFVGGAITGSVAIVSDAVHDMGDALSIGISYFLERKSNKEPDDVYTYGYTRFSVIGSLITTIILLFGSIAVIYNAIVRIFNPIEINYNGMIIFAVVGVIVNFVAALITREGHSLNQKAVNLHMLEDVLGWSVVLIGAVVMHFTDFWILDPILSIGVSLFIFINAIKNLKTMVNLFLEKIPRGIEMQKLKDDICKIEGVLDAHHIHVWSMDGYNNYATMHIVTDDDSHNIKDRIREKVKDYNIGHITLELEASDEHCHHTDCHIHTHKGHHHHHHH